MQPRGTRGLSITVSGRRPARTWPEASRPDSGLTVSIPEAQPAPRSPTHRTPREGDRSDSESLRRQLTDAGSRPL